MYSFSGTFVHVGAENRRTIFRYLRHPLTRFLYVDHQLAVRGFVQYEAYNINSSFGNVTAAGHDLALMSPAEWEWHENTVLITPHGLPKMIPFELPQELLEYGEVTSLAPEKFLLVLHYDMDLRSISMRVVCDGTEVMYESRDLEYYFGYCLNIDVRYLSAKQLLDLVGKCFPDELQFMEGLVEKSRAVLEK
ncbi:CUN041 hypothetical protein [Culex nigripalpus nucleopolyhedrovirus]|uniref:Uncharacterized protein n=2 Tax=Deltabaculovirus TaxID=558019 RepID=Q77GU8_NPVCO|nr:CUN041 hypothetical protein [Culex nigripalpus nucleopolyhedrovirus]AAK13262.1 unknown [Culex nigripalpus nucleopolyhedrovirus]AAK94119.1 CUN041 hypothetical protein [Culex nigripalpus nucleopolyhedrovirus]